MKNLVLVSFLFFSLFSFGQVIQKTNEYKDSLTTNSVGGFDSNQGEQSLIRYLDKMSDEQLLKLLKEQLIIGEIVYKEKPKDD